ncbi:putative capsid triplex subunit 2 [Cyprinid herpesvirus 2]|uniref:Putative capsid triplex subunit 2 n=1 Tax=Cyprinid herpesvirus 2 TaxID=317878 RepID=K7PCC4_CYHV2|nr:putative capsid triplex subunit 2 [Cyprinid herpesvirus 2]AFJ20502.1 putative capsid triplex subunit 2 [Cyprinid herpesvirus 2]
MYGLNNAQGFIDTEWIDRQSIAMTAQETSRLLNPYLATKGQRVDPSNLYIPDGIFVTYTPTGPDPGVAHGGGYYYRPSLQGFGSMMDEADTLDDLQANVLYSNQGQWTRLALCGLANTANYPIDLYDQKDTKYRIINTGAEPLHSGDAFVVEPPSVEASKAQVDSMKNNTIRAEGSFRPGNMALGGYPATNRVPSELTHRMKHVMARDIGMCVDLVQSGSSGMSQGISRLYNTQTELGQSVKNTVMATTLDALDSISVLLVMMKRVASLPTPVLRIFGDYYNFKHNKGQLDPSVLIEIWKNPAVADLFMDSMDFGMKSIHRLKNGTYGSAIKSTEANPTSMRGEVMYNAYGGQYLTGDTFEGIIHSFNGL